MPTFNKLYYMTLSGEKKLNAVTVHISKKLIEESGIDLDMPINITAKKGKIIIEEVGRASSAK